MSHWPDQARRAQFFADLEALIGRYPECADGPPDQVGDAVLDGFDPATPKMVTGLVLLVAYSNVDDWDELTILAPTGQSHHMKVGMLYAALDLQ